MLSRIMYLCVRCIDIAYFYDFSIGFWNLFAENWYHLFHRITVLYYFPSYFGTSQVLLFENHNMYIHRYIWCKVQDREQL